MYHQRANNHLLETLLVRAACATLMEFKGACPDEGHTTLLTRLSLHSPPPPPPRERPLVSPGARRREKVRMGQKKRLLHAVGLCHSQCVRFLSYIRSNTKLLAFHRSLRRRSQAEECVPSAQSGM